MCELEKYYNELEQLVREKITEIKLHEEQTKRQLKNIQDSIQSARKIQTALLPSGYFIEKNLGEHFIFSRPKDIVSGDFYWFHVTDNKIMLAAIDCTGHGVPGAIMSIVGYHQLNNAVNVKKARRPDRILNELNIGVHATLAEETHKSQVTDGMELALCVFDKDKTKVEFSGAYNSLALVRDNVVMEYKGDKFPIGVYKGTRSQVFNLKRIILQPGDCLYLYSDGFQDQFGGERDKKYSSKRLRQKLLHIHRQPCSVQKQLLEKEFDQWKGKNDQVDDVLMIGVKI